MKANKGGPGVDKVTMEDFETDLQGNLYRIWNRMSSGSYFAPGEGSGKTQSRMARVPGCSVYLRSLTGSPRDGGGALHRPWVVLYVKRWLAAPLQHADGTLQIRDRGTRQGSAISPVLANLFMHYAFDAWMVREYPTVRFERYADDAVVHAVTNSQANRLLVAIRDRMVEVGLRLHPAKTKIVYCKDGKRRLDHEHTDFTFLGFTFRARGARGRNGETFTAFLPAMSKDAWEKVSGQIRRWRLHLRTGHSFGELAREINPIVRGWMQYYGAFYRTVLHPLLARINDYLMRWLRKKYRRLRAFLKAKACWRRMTRQYPRLFAHWAWSVAFW